MRTKLLFSIFALSLLLLAACSSEVSEPISETSAERASGEVMTSDAASIDKINLNNMARDQLLDTIPDFNNRMVREFFEYQPYISIQQFRREIGKYVSDDKVAEYEQYIYVPVDVNESDAATVAQIPGVDEAMAESLIANRPFESNSAFLDGLAEIAPDVDMSIAEGFLQN